MLEPAEAFCLSELVEIALLDGAPIGHPQLGDRRRLLPLVHEPHAGREKLARLVHVA